MLNALLGTCVPDYPPPLPPREDNAIPTVATLIEEVQKQPWHEDCRCYDDLIFPKERFISTLEAFQKQFSPLPYNSDTDFGYIEKRLFDADTDVFVRGDVHGDMHTLMRDLEELQDRGALDENWHCRPGHHLLFVGDYVDRGYYSLEVLQVLFCLKMENPESVTLIRGNHEDSVVSSSLRYMPYHQENYRGILSKHSEQLDAAFACLPLSVYTGVKGEDGREHYYQHTHGTFELSVDPYPLLAGACRGTLAIPLSASATYCLSKRMQDLAMQDGMVNVIAQHALENLSDILEKAENRNWRQHYPSTSYNWGDWATDDEMEDFEAFQGGRRGADEWVLDAESIFDYLYLSSAPNLYDVQGLNRGHQHSYRKKEGSRGGKHVAITTLPIGMDCAEPTQEDYTLTLSFKKSLNGCSVKEHRHERLDLGSCLDLEVEAETTAPTPSLEELVDQLEAVEIFHEEDEFETTLLRATWAQDIRLRTATVGEHSPFLDALNLG